MPYYNIFLSVWKVKNKKIMVTPRVELGSSALQADAKSPSAKSPKILDAGSAPASSDYKTDIFLIKLIQ